MNKVLIGLLVAALAGLGLWKLGVFGAGTAETPEYASEGGRPKAANPDGPGLEPGIGAREVPKEQPRPEWFPVTEPLRVLFVLHHVDSFPALQSQTLAGKENAEHVESSVWASDPGPDPKELSHSTYVREKPNGQWLDVQDFHVLVVVGLDPAALPDDFWQAVTQRVTGGRMGLWVQPDSPQPAAGSSAMPRVHPMLTHPLFSALLPVAEAAPLEGRFDPATRKSSVPGTFTKVAPFVVTEAGTKHPATRIVPWPEWSRRIWGEGGSGPQPWGSLFCYPVTKLAPSAVTLVNAGPEKSAPIPVLVVGAPAGGRVLWFGAHDFGDATYRNNVGLEKVTALLNNSIVWLAGRAPAE